MIRQRIDILEYDWTVWCYYAVSTYYIGEIAEKLHDIGCNEDFLQQAIANMSSGVLNNGLTYSNTQNGESVLVVALTSSADEFLNSMTHELHHLIEHICHARGLDWQGEETAYLCGDTAQRMFPYVRELICEHCRENAERHY